MKVDVFLFKDYRSFLLHVLGDKTERRGLKLQAARHIGCHTTVISHVLHGKIELNLEQAEKFCGFLNFTADEEHYFLLLVQRERAGTRALKTYFQKQIDLILKNRHDIKERIGSHQVVTKEVSQRYYSSWLYAALHVALSIPELRSIKELSRRFQVAEPTIADALEFLISAGLAINDKNGLNIGPKHVHLGSQSTNITSHHRNWRLQALHSLELAHKNDLHYSSAVTLSAEDVSLIKEKIIESLKDLNKTIAVSKEEEVFVLNFDFFRL